MGKANLAQLRTLLQQGRWKQADQETGKNIVESVKPGDDVLYERDMPKLELELLREVDRLWQDASHQRFGFTPHLQAWQRAGADRDLFATFLGWRRRGIYITYFAAQFDLSAPEGHLPIGGPEGIVFHDDRTIMGTLREMAKSSYGLWARERGGPRRLLWLYAKQRLLDVEPSSDLVGHGMEWTDGRPLLLERFGQSPSAGSGR